MIYQPGVGKHITPSTSGRTGREIETATPQRVAEEIAPDQVVLPRAVMASTRSSFLANWQDISDAAGYRIDVSTAASFNNYVDGYHGLDVGQTSSRIIGGLNPRTKYYYRVRPYNSSGTGSNSATMTATTAITSGLVMNPTFDSSITSNPNSAAIQATITQAMRFIKHSLAIRSLSRFFSVTRLPSPTAPPWEAVSR